MDQRNIVLWGTSYAGGHVLTAAAAFNASSIKAVVAQVPHLSGPAASKVSLATRGTLATIRLGVAGKTHAMGARGHATLFLTNTALAG